MYNLWFHNVCCIPAQEFIYTPYAVSLDTGLFTYLIIDCCNTLVPSNVLRHVIVNFNIGKRNDVAETSVKD